MKERPIIFTGESVRAILDGRKTQTRRLCAKAIDHGVPALSVHHDGAGTGWIAWWGKFAVDAENTKRLYPGSDGFTCPHGAVGDRLWVRETFNADWCDHVIFKADGGSAIEEGWSKEPRWKSPFFLKRKDSRIDLEITDVRVQRLTYATEKDARAEGFCSLDAMAVAWNAINGKRATWSSSPWVWALTFRRVKP